MIRDALLICDTNVTKNSAATTASGNCIDLKKSRAVAPGEPIEAYASWTFTSGTTVTVQARIIAATNADLSTGKVVLADSGAITISASTGPILTKTGTIAPYDGKFTHLGIEYVVGGSTPNVTLVESGFTKGVPSNIPANLP